MTGGLSETALCPGNLEGFPPEPSREIHLAGVLLPVEEIERATVAAGHLDQPFN